MKASEIQIGNRYIIRHNGTLCQVQVTGTHVTNFGPTRTRYDCWKPSTQRAIMIKSAAKFRREALPMDTIK